jgi:O-antigen/teichoic acid export membrane protein
MGPSSRTDNSIRNSLFALGSQFVGILAMFACRTVFIRMLGSEYLGINGLFNNILSILSLSELGIGTAVLTSMYRPVAIGDTGHIRALLALYAKAYRIVGTVVLILGLALLPFLDLFMKGRSEIPNLRLIYLMYLAEAVVSYFFSYKQALLEANQKSYLIDAREMGFDLVVNAAQIVLLLLTHSFVLYLTCQIISTILLNVVLFRLTDRLYPFVKGRIHDQLPPEKRRQVMRNIKAMVTHQVGDVLVNSTDSIMISAFIGVHYMGLYSNYLLISQTIHGILSQMLEAITASVGNLDATENSERSFEMFKRILLINAWLYGFAAISLWFLLDPFIAIWIGPEYWLSRLVVTLTCANFFFTGMRKTVIIFRNSRSLYWFDRFNPIAEAAINLTTSLWLVGLIGLPGILMGKLISTVTTCMWVEPFVLFRHGFGKPLRQYFVRFFGYLTVILAAGVLTDWCIGIVILTGWIRFLVSAALCLAVPNIVFLLSWGWSPAFKGVYISVTSKFRNR